MKTVDHYPTPAWSGKPLCSQNQPNNTANVFFRCGVTHHKLCPYFLGITVYHDQNHATLVFKVVDMDPFHRPFGEWPGAQWSRRWFLLILSAPLTPSCYSLDVPSYSGPPEIITDGVFHFNYANMGIMKFRQ